MTGRSANSAKVERMLANILTIESPIMDRCAPPVEIQFGQAEAIHAARQIILDAAKAHRHC